MTDDLSSRREEILFLARAESRVQIMDALRDTDSMTQQELRERSDASRTTVSRALRSLTERGWVMNVDGSYRQTLTGEHIAAAFDQLVDTIGKLEELDEFLKRFPPEIEGPDFLNANDVKVTYATDAAPYAPARTQSEILRTADELRILLPAVDTDSTDVLLEQVTRGLDVETIVSSAVESVITSDAFAPQVKQMLEAGGLSIRVCHREVPFYLGLADGSITQLGLADEDGLPKALLETGDEDVYVWAERFYHEMRDCSDVRASEDF